MIGEIIQTLGAFLSGIAVDRFLKRGSTKIINQQVRAHYPFAYLGAPSKITRFELQVQFVNTSGYASLISDIFLRMKLHDFPEGIGLPFGDDLPPAVTVKENSIEKVSIDIPSFLTFTHSDLMLEQPTFVLYHKINGRKKELHFTQFCLIEDR